MVIDASKDQNLDQLMDQAHKLLDGEANGQSDDQQRRYQTFLKRVEAALIQLKKFSFKHPNNGDEQLYAKQNYIGSYTKALPHNGSGEVNPSDYQALLKAVQTGNFADFENIKLGGDTKLTNPQSAYAFELEGIDSHGLTMPPAPALSSAQEASEMVELYWQALTRDVPFSQYETNQLTQAAAADLSTLSDFRGPKAGNSQVTPATLFRGGTSGDLAGPYVSQFLLVDVPYGIAGAFPGASTPVPPNTQRRPFAQPGKDFITAFAEWLRIQNGSKPSVSTKLDEVPRYIHTSRDLVEYVHRDYPYQTFVNACLILLSYGPDALDPANLYLRAKKQNGFVTFGASDVLDLVARVANEALKHAWYQKWLVHRRLRPEEFAGWIDNQLNGRSNYPLNSEVLKSPVLKEVFSRYGSYLLPQAFPEGCPTHPAYPSGHATYAGACVTVLKAFFNEDFEIPNPVFANEDGTELLPYSARLTVGGELNKLATNIAIARDAAGVHWRTDGIEGLKLGEAVAISFLQDRTRLYNEPFSGFTFTKFDGTAFLAGTGLTGQYFNNLDLTNLVLTRTDAMIDFNWGSKAPDALIQPDTFSVRWTGQLQPRYSETYTFYTTTDDGVRLWVNGQLLIDRWVDQGATTWSGKIALNAGQKYDLRMEYYENGGSANARLEWESPSQARQVIPQSQLFLCSDSNNNA